MAFTTEAIGSGIPSINPVSEITKIPDGPSFMGYDPKGTMSVTGSPLIRAEPQIAQNLKQDVDNEGLPQESVRLSSKISALARKEQAQRQREMAFKRREQELSQKLADAEKFAQIREKIANKDYSGAEELGLSYEEHTQQLLNKQASEDPAEQRARKLEEQIESLKKAQEEQTVREYEANQQLWRQDISRVLQASDDFPTIRELGAEDTVLKHINDSFEQDEIELTTEDACKEIEEALESRVDKYASLTKVRRKIEESRSLGPPKPGSKTITQQMTVTSEKQKTKPFHLMSESEQLAEAIRRVQAEKLQQR